MNPYESLANGIILQAVKDYRTALKDLKKRPTYDPAIVMKRDCERFFQSAWFAELTTVDGRMLMRKLQEEVN